MLGKKKVKLLKSLLKEIEEDVEMLNNILDEPYLYSNNRQASMAAFNIGGRAEAIQNYLYPRGLKTHAVIDEEWEEKSRAPKWYKNLGVLCVEDVEE